MTSIKVKISAQAVTERVVKPLSEIGIKHQRVGSSFVTSLENSLELSGVDYSSILVMEQNPYDVATIDVYEYCEDTWKNIFEGEFNWFNVNVDRDKKKLTISPKERTVKSCIESKWELDSVSIFYGTIQIVRPLAGVYEVQCCSSVSASFPDGSIFSCGLNPSEWWMKENTFTNIGFGQWEHKTCWHRVKQNGTCSGVVPIPPSGTGWVLLTNNCPTDSVWIRDSANDYLIALMKNGRMLNSSLNSLFNETGCGLTLRSNFLNINPSGPSPNNQAYKFSTDYLQELTLHQKSDVKRPMDTNPATVVAWTVTLKDIILDLIDLLNMEIRYDPVNNEARFEHVSFFASVATVNHSSIAKKNEYSQDQDNSERYEKYSYMDEMCSDYFKGKLIEYNTGSGVAPIRLRKISTDVVFIQQAGASDQSINDSGFVLCSTKLIGGVRSLLEYNRPLAWTSLHENLFRWNRRFPAGKINDVPVLFYTWKLRKKYPAYVAPFCCSGAWDFYSIIQNGTELGEVQEAVYYPQKGIAKINVNY